MQGSESIDESTARRLLERWQQEEDRDALDQLLRAEIDDLAQRLRQRIGARLGPSASSSDLVQEAVARFLGLQQPPPLNQPSQLRAYLWKAAWHLFIDHQRAPLGQFGPLPVEESRALTAFLAKSDGQGRVERNDQGEALQLAIQLLSDSDRQLLEEVYFQETPIEVAAQKLGVSRANLDMRLSRARRRLAEKLVDWSELIG